MRAENTPSSYTTRLYAFNLLNADYKMLNRVIAYRLHPRLAKILNPSQHCGMRGHIVYDAIATVRDRIAHAEYSKSPLCIVFT